MEDQIKIPEFKTIEDMAKFWDSHDIQISLPLIF